MLLEYAAEIYFSSCFKGRKKAQSWLISFIYSFFFTFLFCKLGWRDQYHSSIHCWDRKLPPENISMRRFSSRLDPGPGLKISASPQTEHVLFPGSPKHHPPGTTLPGLRFKISLSMRSSTGSSNWNCEAKIAPLWIISSNSVELSVQFCLDGLSQATYSKLSFMTVLLNWWELHRMVGK